MPTVNHIEVAADDPKRAVDFYGKLFGWQWEKMPGPMEYWVAKTAGPDGTPGPGFGLMERQDPHQRITVYVTVPSLAEATAKVKKLGGQVCMDKTAVPGMGYFAVCIDTEQNGFALWQMDESAK